MNRSTEVLYMIFFIVVWLIEVDNEYKRVLRLFFYISLCKVDYVKVIWRVEVRYVVLGEGLWAGCLV